MQSGLEGAGGGRSVLEAVSLVAVEIIASLFTSVVSVVKCRSDAGRAVMGFESCSISVVSVSLRGVSGSERGGGGISCWAILRRGRVPLISGRGFVDISFVSDPIHCTRGI